MSEKNEIKAIQTRYNGYRFRSRLEARWAVFFDSIGERYEYESEGFVLFKDYCYLPDFHLPEIDTWVEIKPIPTQEDPTLEDLILSFSFGAQVNYFLRIWGTPGDDCVVMLYGKALGEPESFAGRAVYLGYDDSSEHLVFIPVNPIKETYEKTTAGDRSPETIQRVKELFSEVAKASHPRIYEAYKAGREARFEHGEKGGAH